MRARIALLLALASWDPASAGFVADAGAQAIPAGRVAVLQAESRGAAAGRDLATIRAGVMSGDPQTVRIAVRALGRLQRPALIIDLTPSLRHRLPEIRAEAANAIAQAAQGLKADPKSGSGTTAATIAATLIARLKIEDDASVRAALCESMARLPYTTATDVARAEAALLDAGTNTGITDRLGVAKGFEALLRVSGWVGPTTAPAIEYLNGTVLSNASRSDAEAMRDVRVRRLALDALIAARATTEATIDRAAADPDAQVRRLAMQAVERSGHSAALAVTGLADPAPMVRIAALRSLQVRGHGDACGATARAVRDSDLAVSLVAIDLLAACGVLPDAVATLERTISDAGSKAAGRAWQRGAHALVALADAAPDRARAALPRFSQAPEPTARLYAAYAAEKLRERTPLEKLAGDDDDRVANAALAALEHAVRPPTAGTDPAAIIDAAELRRLAAPRARITIRGVGVIDVALFTAEAPATVLRFAAAASAGAYNGRAFGRPNPGGFAQLGDRAWPEPPSSAGAEVGLWPHVRGTLAVAVLEGSAVPDFFFDLVDAPRLDHVYTVFGQVLNGNDLLDQIAEGDVIDSIEILP